MPHTDTNIPTVAPVAIDGAQAWWACGLTVIVLFLTFGLVYSYGVFFEAIAHEFQAGHGAAAGLFSITSLWVYGLGVVTGPLADRWGPRPLLIAGGLAMGSGLWFTANATSLWQAYLGYGAGLGLGAGCVYVPVVSAIGRWFARYRGLALGIAVSGIGLGTLVVAPLSEQLISMLGWRETYMLYGGVAAAGLCVAGLAFPTPPAAPVGRIAADVRQRSLFAKLYGATVVLNLVLYVPFVLLPASAVADGISALAAAGLIGILGISSVAGRLLIGFVSHRYDTLSIYRACFALIAVSFLLWLVADRYAVYVLFSIVIGLGYGGYIALTPTVLAEMFGPAGLGRRLGLLYTGVALGACLGPWAAGLAVDRTQGYAIPAAFFFLIGCLACFMISRVSTRTTD